jgi:hypothetical protein
VVVIVADTILVPGRRPGGLNPPDQTVFGQHRQGVVHCLPRNGTDLATNRFGNVIRRRVRTTRDGPQHRYPLRSDLQTTVAKKFRWVIGHSRSINEFWT